MKKVMIKKYVYYVGMLTLLNVISFLAYVYIEMFEIPFNEVRKYSLVIIMIISCILCLLRLYALAFPFLGLGLSEYYLSKFDNLYTGIDNIVPTLNSDISLLRTALKHAQIESFDKEKLYQRGLSITPTTKWAYFYYQDLVVEAIIDSIIDNKEYIKKE